MISLRILCALIALLPSYSWAEDLVVRLLAGDDNSYTQRISASLLALLQTEPTIRVESGAGGVAAKGLRRLTVAVGAKAWRSYVAEGGAEGPLLVVAPTRTAFEELRPRFSGKPLGVIFMDMPPGRFLNLIQAAMPQRTSVGMVASISTLVGPHSLAQLGRFEASASERGLRLISDKVTLESEVGPAVERLVRQSSVFLAIPDPLVHTANTVQPLLLLSYRANVPVVGYSESYLKAGAILALYATPEQLAQQALETILSYRQGKSLPSVQLARYFTVRSNDTVARSLGLVLPGLPELEERIRQMRE